ncbi:LacI family DNA-binding transcriptional regulator [Solirubrobacter sp. CPCC 204708]|uniref:LacI family DNA-binding transcriptional regulator n=1 Tax=Solirubrobacter deserti TaxID=2282478 RepID=A0ABT4RR86_9ACTN|nr:LacI family DNA-binding transcriptional regulator [Solirubrobacter deserti]MBE2314855.1 LacI family DNA-binding transcriptional regulator [Solirubrobacter deserti]MDA0141082.1 LacI family DNA-binding transcriptional regulator [Solirubrobacter deserti]
MSATRPTLATIAEALSVSRMTVSNAFNRPDQLSPELRERVLAKARELGYAGPDPVARTLSRGRTGSIGVMFDAPLTVAFSDPAAVQLFTGVAMVCEQQELGMALVPRIAGRDDALVRTALVDGFVVYSMGHDDPRLRAIRDRQLPFVLVDHDPTEAPLTVNVEDRAAARTTAEHLLALGHRRFGIVMGGDEPDASADQALVTLEYHDIRERLTGWREALEPAGVAWSGVALASAPGFGRPTGRVAGGKLLDRGDRPTAILCSSDVLALGVLDAAAERGVEVPTQLSVTGFDDIPDAVHAGLTTVRQPHQEKGATALRLLLDKAAPQASVLLPAEFIPRSTTAPIPPHAHR